MHDLLCFPNSCWNQLYSALLKVGGAVVARVRSHIKNLCFFIFPLPPLVSCSVKTPISFQLRIHIYPNEIKVVAVFDSPAINECSSVHAQQKTKKKNKFLKHIQCICILYDLITSQVLLNCELNNNVEREYYNI